ncbi:amidohydrolase family protein [Aestuariibacter halophilus]|uniref:Amidohydrolase family protein n=1 Tax=Fluctibacter halophilus TaxID=226011 RepID=A0ABS8G9R2_9ALTE|nr:amidohydrolase family protein [Aestuariibacter halophilus]MCC2616851.1 amidohydrolase family protein [Aestuariibacter halophilus]
MLTRTLAGLSLTLLAHTVSANDVLIRNVTVVSAQHQQPLTQRDVRLVDGRIATVSAEPLSADPADTMVIDGSGKFLVPGLMDSHVHVGSIPGLGFVSSPLAQQHPQLVAAYFDQQPRSFLYHGVTQVMDLGSQDGREAFTSASLHPDFYSCVPIPVVGGYPDTDAEFTLGHSNTFIVDANTPPLEGYAIDASQHSPEAVVARIAKTGTRCIKLYLEDGFGAASHWPLPSDDTLQRVRSAADAHGLQLLAHANAIDMYQIALKHNIDVLSHGLWNWQWPEDKGEPPVSDTLDALIAQRTGYMPTLQVMLALQSMFDEDFLADPARRKVLPPSLVAWFTTPESEAFKQELRDDFGPDTPDDTIHQLLGYGLGRAKRATAYLAQQDYPMLLASDYPSSPSVAAAPGLSTYHELLQMHDAGVSLRAIFEAATVNGPKQFGLADDYGTVAVGKVANLLLLAGNPLSDIQAWNDIDTVFLHGQPIARDSLMVKDD